MASDRPLTLDQLPLADLKAWLEVHHAPDADTFLLPKSVRAGSLGLLPTVRAQLSGVQTLITGIVTPIAFDVITRDSVGMHLPIDNTRFICKEAGWYRVGGTVRFVANATGDRTLTVLVNGVESGSQRQLSVGAGSTTRVNVNAEVPVQLNDYIQLAAAQNSGGNLDIDTISGGFWIGYGGT